VREGGPPEATELLHGDEDFMILKWLDNKGVDALAASLAQDLITRVPPAAADASGKKADATQQKARDMVLRKAHDFARDNKLGVYSKARLANKFKWALIEAGYASEFVDKVTYDLAGVVATAQADRGRTAK
jgi:hypothetical protein